MTSSKHLFSVFDVTRQVFYRTPLSFGMVNLKPLIPGHVLIVPRRVVPRLADLRPEEVSDLFLAAQHVGSVLERTYEAQALTISLQDGVAAGQSVPHVHIHIMPRKRTDFGGDNDKVYPALEKHEQHLASAFKGEDQPQTLNGITEWRVPKDDDRKPRSGEEMEKEARWLMSLFV